MALLKAIGPPGSLGFLLAGIAVSLALGYLWPRRRRLALACLLALFGSYLVLAWPPAARTLVNSLPAPGPTAPGAVPVIDVLLVFDGDNRQGRARLVRQLTAAAVPPALHVVGSPLILSELPPDLVRRLTHHPAATTRDQVAWVRRFAATDGGVRAAILVSRLQAPRVARLTARAGLDMPVLASELDVELPATGWRRLAPGVSALAVGRDALYEHLALRYYRFRGWI